MAIHRIPAKSYIAEKKGVSSQREGAKKGGPKNEGISTEVYENKGQKLASFLFLQMLLKTHDLSRFLQMLLKTNTVKLFLGASTCHK
jgi:hypothetical protein